jgi:hypothetical protein
VPFPLFAKHLVRSPANQLALVMGAGEFNGTRLPLTLSAGDPRCSIRRAANNLVQSHLPLVAVREADYGHPEVKDLL